jgi:hypothetical protein
MQTKSTMSLVLRVESVIRHYQAKYKCLPYALVMNPQDLRVLLAESYPLRAVPAGVRLRCTPRLDKPALLSEWCVAFDL